MNSGVESSTILFKIYSNKALRFLLSAGIATIIDVFIYFVAINFLIVDLQLSLLGHSILNHEIALIISYTIGFCCNFLITKYAVFNESDLRSRNQFIRFSLIAIMGFFANYGLLRFFVEFCGFWPTISRIFSALSLGLASFYIHKQFTFKISNNDQL